MGRWQPLQYIMLGSSDVSALLHEHVAGRLGRIVGDGKRPLVVPAKKPFVDGEAVSVRDE